MELEPPTADLPPLEPRPATRAAGEGTLASLAIAVACGIAGAVVGVYADLAGGDILLMVVVLFGAVFLARR